MLSWKLKGGIRTILTTLAILAAGSEAAWADNNTQTLLCTSSSSYPSITLELDETGGAVTFTWNNAMPDGAAREMGTFQANFNSDNVTFDVISTKSGHDDSYTLSNGVWHNNASNLTGRLLTSATRSGGPWYCK